MREIKFRAWLKEHEIMGYPSSVKIGHPEGIFEISVPFDSGIKTFRKLYSVDEFEIMQYTGLLDKNGKEIYEGDIFGGAAKAVVEWKAGEAGFGITTGQYMLGNYNGTSEIIGNIYENPELLVNN